MKTKLNIAKALFKIEILKQKPKALNTGNKASKTINCKKAIYNPENLNRIIKCGFGRNINDEIYKIKSNVMQLKEIESYEISNAIIYDGLILLEKDYYFLSSELSFNTIMKRTTELNEATLLNTKQGLRYFGHWLQDDCAMYEKIKDAQNIFSLTKPRWPDISFYTSAFDQRWNELNIAHIRKLHIHRELGFNLSKLERWNNLRNKLREKHQTQNNNGGIVYIKRGNLGDKREIVNEQELINKFIASGIKIIEPATGGEKFIPEILDASIIIAVEGSQLCHAVYSIKNNGGIVVLQPPERFYNPHIEWCRLMNISYALVIGEKHGDGFKIYANEVLEAIEDIIRIANS